MEPSTITFVVLAAAVIAFVSGRIPIPLVALGVPVALWATGVIPLAAAFAGFGDPTVIFIASLFVVSESLDATGVTTWVGQQIIRRGGVGRGRLTVLIAIICAVLAAFISINGAVAALLPVAVVVAVRAGIVPSRMLIPLAFAASAGSLLTLTGTPVNIVVSEFAASAGGREFGYFEFALVGLPIVVCTVAIVALAGGRLLPERSAEQLGETADVEGTARALREQYAVELDDDALFNTRQGVLEVLIAPRSTLIDRTVCAGMRTRKEDLVILAARRGDEAAVTMGQLDAPWSLRLRAGDAVLVQGPWESLERYARSSDVIAVTAPQSLQRGLPLGRGARRALIVLGAMVVVLATGLVPAAIVGVLAAGLIIATRVLTVPQAFRAISWTTVVLIAGMIPLSAAMVSSGAAGIVGEAVTALTGGGSPHLTVLVLCLAAVVLGQFISNTATVLILAPVAVSVATELQFSIQPFMMALTVAGAASFLTPVATPVNLMVMQPGGYRFGDYWRLGVPLTIVFLAFAVLYVPLIWPF